MSTFRTPVGPQSSRTYWRRRLVVILGILAVIVVVALIVGRPGSSKTPASTADPKSSSSPAPATSDAPAADGTCAPASISVVAITDAGSYADGQQPLLSLSITNTGTTECTFAVGTDVQDYTITSGTEKIWSSKDCQSAPAALIQTLKPGVALTTTPFAWGRTRSDTATCASTNLPQVTAGGASYHLAATVNGVTSKETKQFLLN